MTKNQIIKRLVLGIEIMVDDGAGDVSPEAHEMIEFIFKLNQCGYPSYPAYRNQTEEQKREIQELIVMEPKGLDLY